MKFILILFFSLISIDIFSLEFPITQITNDQFMIKGYMFSYTADNKPEPFEVGQTFIPINEEIVFVSLFGYRLFMGLESPETHEIKYFESTINSVGNSAKVRDVIETSRRLSYQRNIVGDGEWVSNINFKVTFEDETEYTMAITSSSEEASERHKKNLLTT